MPSKFRESLIKIVNEDSSDERLKMVEDIADEFDDEDLDNLKTIKEERDSIKEKLSKTEARYEELDKRYKERFVMGAPSGADDEDEDEDKPPTEPVHKSLKDLGF